MNQTIDFKDFVPKFDALLARGLSHGLGMRDGQMCVEAAVCAALGLDHGDDPQCVASAVRAFKIKLNDASWSSPMARAAGLRDLGIAQVGSRGVVDDTQFVKILADKTIRVFIPALFRDVLKKYPRCLAAADRCEREGGIKAITEAKNAADAADAYAADADAADVYAAAAYDAAAYAAAAAAYDAAAYDAAAYAAAAYAAAAAAAAYAAAQRRGNKYLLLMAQLALEVLCELKSPGCKWIGGAA